MINVSDLRRQRQTERSAKLSGKPSLFQLIWTWSEEVLLLCLASWAYVKWVARFISPAITIVGLLAVVIIFFSLQFFLRKFPQTWVTGNDIERISSIPRKGKVFLVMITLALIAPRIVDFTSPPPDVEVSLKKAPGRYAEGFRVDGIQWRKDFSEHQLVFKNKDTNVELADVRIDLKFPAGVVNSNVLLSKGVDTVSVAPFGFTAARGNQKGEMIDPLKAYRMNLLITAVRVFAGGEFTTRIILMDPFFGKTVTATNDMSADMCMSFYHDDFWGYKTKRSVCYPLSRNKETDGLSLSIDLENPISPETRKLEPGVVFHDPQQAKDLNVILNP